MFKNMRTHGHAHMYANTFNITYKVYRLHAIDNNNKKKKKRDNNRLKSTDFCSSTFVVFSPSSILSHLCNNGLLVLEGILPCIS